MWTLLLLLNLWMPLHAEALRPAPIICPNPVVTVEEVQGMMVPNPRKRP